MKKWKKGKTERKKYWLPAWGGSAKLHAIDFWASHSDQPCDPNYSIPQAGTIGALSLCMETMPQMAFSD
jgi:hypothetical protein